ncbi:uncharacterized protein BDR25DRAFT_261738 [Lindgomyces ingoldianus]|uniref:Uncharacterized protein n=1 Tax=Lindgomyces ingoldianus TaxID=673940 RepID=A0ACB6QWS2_9PLEO|nr:uncharacterized protein BDR25DRAFT_261738 [Lindgomyces ingoldianus]KAF2470646.1 hypothetical protein BDR25DRAFT_261738 [Lindgomyces ingoldianus]
MADSAATATAESPAQEKARLRRERRAAKIQAGGASRLQAISQLQGGSHRDVEKDVPVKPSPSASPNLATASPANGTSTPDPDEIDISQHHYTPAAQPQLPSPFAFNGTDTPPFPQPGPDADMSQDPMMAMLQQMMGGGAGGIPGMPGGPGQAGQNPGDLPPGLANLFQAMGGDSSTAQPSPSQSSAWLWRLVHSIFSLLLAVYIVFQTPFNGSKLSRTNTSTPQSDDWILDSSSTETFKHFFYMFATFEVAMQSSRYFIERGQLPGSGILSSIAQMLPMPYAGYVRVVGRYSVIYKTVVSDAMVVVFVLGVASWWRGGITS